MARRTEAPTFAFQPSLGEPFSSEFSPQNLEFLSRLKPPPCDYQPLVLIMALAKEPSNNVRPVSLADPTLALTLMPASGDFAHVLKYMERKPRGIIVQVDQATIPEITYIQFGLLRDLADWMKKGRLAWERRVWLVERNPSGLTAERAERMKKLMTERLGLVGARVYQDRTTGLVWVTARPKKETKRKPTNLLHKRYIPPIKEEVAEALAKRGFRIISTQEIDKVLSASTFPLKDLARLKMGWGIWVEASCGQCVYCIDQWGTITKIFDCGEDHEEEIVEAIAAQPVVLGYNLPTGNFCGDCGRRIEVTRILGNQNLLTPKQKQQDLVVVLEQVACVNNCGSLWTYNIICPRALLRKEN